MYNERFYYYFTGFAVAAAFISFSFTFQRNWLLNNNNNNFSTETKQREGSKNKSIFFPLPSNCYSSISFISMFVTPCMFGNFRCTTNCWSFFDYFVLVFKNKIVNTQRSRWTSKMANQLLPIQFHFILFFTQFFTCIIQSSEFDWFLFFYMLQLNVFHLHRILLRLFFFSFYSLPKSDRSDVVIIRFGYEFVKTY